MLSFRDLTDPNIIFTDEAGQPFARPEKPPEPMTAEQRIRWWREVHAFGDRITDHANRAFADQFRRSLRNRR